MWLFNLLLNSKVNGYHIGDIFWNFTLIIFTYYIFYTFKYLTLKKTHSWQNIFLIILFIIWFFFLPNALYLITDIRHLMDYCPSNSYLDICPNNSWMLPFFFLYAIIGWYTFYDLLSKMANLFKKNVYKQLIIHSSLILAPLGVLIGLLNRVNSWNLITNPSKIFHVLYLYISDWLYIQQFLAYVISTYILFYLTKYLFDSNETRLFRRRKQSKKN